MRKVTAKAARKKTAVKSKARKPVDLEVLRVTIANSVGAAAVDICCALAEEAQKGELAPAKFLFEMIGLYPVAGANEDDEFEQDGEEGGDLAQVLLRRLTLPAEKAGESIEAVPSPGAQSNSVE